MKLSEYTRLSKRERSKVISHFIGHKVDEICECPSGYINKENSEYIQRFRHETYAYSEIILFEREGVLSAKLKNFVSGDYEEL